MNRAARLASILLLTTSLAAGAKDNQDVVVVKDPAAIAAVVQTINDAAPATQKQWQETQENLVRTAPDRARKLDPLPAHLAGMISDWSAHTGRSSDPSYCAIPSDCPLGHPGSLTLGQLRATYRNVPDSDLWDICVGRKQSSIYGIGVYAACAMIGAPDPLRPVELPNAGTRDRPAEPPNYPQDFMGAARDPCEVRGGADQTEADGEPRKPCAAAPDSAPAPAQLQPL